MHKKAQNFNDMKFNRVCVNKQVKASVCVRVCVWNAIQARGGHMCCPTFQTVQGLLGDISLSKENRPNKLGQEKHAHTQLINTKTRAGEE